MDSADLIVTSGGTYTIRRAGLDGIEAVVDIVAEAEAWLQSRGIDQAHIDRASAVASLRTAMDGPTPAREVYLVWSDAEPVATLALQWEDNRTWGEFSDDMSLYLYSLAVRRSVAGQGLGQRMLEWAAGKAAAAGKTYLRLDCMAENAALRSYYERAGFVHRGDVQGTNWSASLYEKRVERGDTPREMRRGEQRESIVKPAGTLTVARAQPEDLEAVLAIEYDATDWARARGINPGRPPRPLRDIYTDRIDRGEAFLARVDGEPAAMLTLQWADRAMWPEAADDAAYVHGLMVRRAFAGQQVGLNLLRWAEHVAAAAGRTYLRLDCMAGNRSLRTYYEQAGFAYRGDVQRGDYVGSRYERQVTGGDDGADEV
jgi:GNAT superfamily N-acetyltransferase